MRRAFKAGLLGAGALLACGPAAKGPSPDAGEGGPVACPVELTYRDTGSDRARAFASGAWNGHSEAGDELLDDGTGTYRLQLSLLPGEYPYRLRVDGDGRSPWRLDPANPWRSSWEGAEVSGLRVEDCRLPRLEVSRVEVEEAAGRVRAELRYAARRAGPLSSVSARIRHAGHERGLSAEELQVEGDVLRLALDGLARGKHAVTVQVMGSTGAVSEPLRLPLWSEPARFSWDGALLYMAVTDRYRNGDPANDGVPTSASPGARWVGGDLDGVRASLEDGTFAQLGVGALWLTPFQPNPEGAEVAGDGVHTVSGYHGYWPIRPEGVDARYGGEAALDRLVEAAHARGVRVMLDAVINHVHAGHGYVTAHPEWFQAGCTCGTPGCDWTQMRLQCLFRPYLPDVDWLHPGARARFIEDVVAFVERHDLDGVRLDAVKHVPDLAVRNLAVRLRERLEGAGTAFFLMGETAMGWDPNAGPAEGGNVDNYGIISRYVGPHGLDGQFDFPLYYAAALAFLQDGPGRGMAHVDYWTRASLTQYPAGAVMTPYLGSHDVPRFVTLGSDASRAWSAWDNLPGPPLDDGPHDRMYAAFGWLMSLPGMPLLYAGDEYGDYGGADPDNRHPWRPRAQLSPREARQLDRVSALARARRDAPGLRSRTYRTLLATEDTWVVARGEGAEAVLVVVHRGSGAFTLPLDVPRDVAPEGATFRDMLGAQESFVVTRAGMDVALAPWSVRYLRRVPGP
jgi:glycosidase